QIRGGSHGTIRAGARRLCRSCAAGFCCSLRAEQMRKALNLMFVLLAGQLETEAAQEASEQWHQGKGYSWASLNVPAGGKTGFKLLPPEETGINFTNTLDLRAGEANRVLFNGSGVAVGDFDDDGLPDLYFCSLNGHNALYKNLGAMRFKDVTAQSGIVCSNQF